MVHWITGSLPFSAKIQGCHTISLSQYLFRPLSPCSLHSLSSCLFHSLSPHVCFILSLPMSVSFSLSPCLFLLPPRAALSMPLCQSIRSVSQETSARGYLAGHDLVPAERHLFWLFCRRDLNINRVGTAVSCLVDERSHRRGSQMVSSNGDWM